jgi:predicted MFS family arabinose efflux permease
MATPLLRRRTAMALSNSLIDAQALRETEPCRRDLDKVNGLRASLLLISLFSVSVFAQIDRILPFILAEAIKPELGLTDTQLGLVTGIAFAVCYSITSLPLARMADRGSPRRVLTACTLIWSVMTAFGGIATSFATLAATRVGVALGEAGAIPSAHALIARKIDPRRRGLAIGIVSMGIPLGTMIGFAAGGAVSDALGWRAAFLGAGALGVIVAVLTFLAAGPTLPNVPADHAGSFLDSSQKLLAIPAFRWLFVGAMSIGFAAAPFYAFGATFLIRAHNFAVSEAGLAFGLVQGIMGVLGTVIGGRSFDRAVRRREGALLLPPALAFFVAFGTTAIALFASAAWLSVVLLAPAMFAFAFALPYAFGSAHLVAGAGKEATASSLGMIGTSLIGPALGPLSVGIISDWTTAAGLKNGIAIGLLIVPLACLATGLIFLVAGRRISANSSPSSR